MKFFGAVHPESEILLRAEKLAQDDNLWQFKVTARVSGQTVAEGQLVLSRAPESPPTALE
jgi:3-hydroxymyristoyl/3-hydroxydecanoyl-(acyl carrier protein) dehydratase